MSELIKSVLIPYHWVAKPNVSTLTELKVRRKKSVLGEPKDINSKSSHYLNDMENDKQYHRKRQGLSVTPQDFPKKTVDFEYNFTPVHNTYSDLVNQRNVFRLKDLETKLSKPEKNSDKDTPDIFFLPKLVTSDNMKTKFGNKQFSSQTPEGITKKLYMLNENNNITPKPTEVKFEDYSNNFIFSKSKPVFRNKLNFLDIFDRAKQPCNQRMRVEDEFEYRQYRNGSFNITKRLKFGQKKFSSKFLTSGFIKNT